MDIELIMTDNLSAPAIILIRVFHYHLTWGGGHFMQNGQTMDENYKINIFQSKLNLVGKIKKQHVLEYLTLFYSVSI